MRGSTKRFFSIILSAILLIAAVFVYSTFVLPEYDIVNNLRGEFASKQATLDSQQQIISKVKSLLTKYKSIPDLANVMSLLLPADDSISSVFQQIYGMATDSGLNIQQFGLNTNVAVQPTNISESAIKGLGTIQVNLNLVGTYAGLKRFTRLVEKNIRLMDIVGLKIQSVGQSNQDLYFFNFVINTYYQTD